MLENRVLRHILSVFCFAMLIVGFLVCLSIAKDAPGIQLQYRTIGKTGLKVTAVSMDCMNAQEDMVAAASSRGINWFDTAWFFGRGRNEWAVGRALKGKRDDVYLCTKIPLGTKDEMLKYLGMSLRRLQTDHVDMLMLHGALRPETVLNPDAIAALQEAKASGKAHLIGVSINRGLVKCLDAAIEAGVYDAVQTIYTPKAPEEVKEAVARAHKSGLVVIAMYVHPTRIDNPAADFDADAAAIREVLDDPNITFVVAEALNMEQIESNIAAMQKATPAPKDETRLERQ